MGRPIGPKKVHRYSVEFKLTAVKLSRMPGVEVQTVAEALAIHPIMLSQRPFPRALTSSSRDEHRIFRPARAAHLGHLIHCHTL